MTSLNPQSLCNNTSLPVKGHFSSSGYYIIQQFWLSAAKWWQRLWLFSSFIKFHVVGFFFLLRWFKGSLRKCLKRKETFWEIDGHCVTLKHLAVLSWTCLVWAETYKYTDFIFRFNVMKVAGIHLSAFAKQGKQNNHQNISGSFKQSNCCWSSAVESQTTVRWSYYVLFKLKTLFHDQI